MLDLLGELVEQDSGRMSVNRGAGELVVHFGGDHHQGGALREAGPLAGAQGSPCGCGEAGPRRTGRGKASRSRRGGRARGSRACWDGDPVMPSSDRRLDRSPPMRAPDEAEATQLDLFAGSGLAPSPTGAPQPASGPAARPPGDLDDAALIAALPRASAADGPALALEAGRRGLLGGAPHWRNSVGGSRVRSGARGPERVAALEALAMIGGGVAARAVAASSPRAPCRDPR